MVLPKVFIEGMRAVPKNCLDKVCDLCKFEYKGSKVTTQVLFEVLEKGDLTALRNLHQAIAPALLIGGMAPGVGLACNLIDAAFCFAFGAWLDFAIDVIAICLFEVPGVSGLKGISKGLLGLCKSVKIDAKAFWKILDKVSKCNVVKEGKIHQLFSFFMSRENTVVRNIDFKGIANSIPSLNNPFCKWSNQVLKKIASECEECLTQIH